MSIGDYFGVFYSIPLITMSIFVSGLSLCGIPERTVQQQVWVCHVCTTKAMAVLKHGAGQWELSEVGGEILEL